MTATFGSNAWKAYDARINNFMEDANSNLDNTGSNTKLVILTRIYYKKIAKYNIIQKFLITKIKATKEQIWP